MTLVQALNWATKKLKKNKIISPALDAEIILSFSIKKTKEFLYAHPEKNLSATQFSKFKNLIARRAKNEPIAYITGRKHFYGLDFFVNKNVLIPRPETELLVEETIGVDKRQKIKDKRTIVDVGTGSGSIAVLLAHHLSNAKIFATEISPGAIKIAQKNARRHKSNVTFLRGNLLQPFIQKLGSQFSNLKSLVVVANLPYLTTGQWQHAQPEIRKCEPRQALDGGPDGLKYYRELLSQLRKIITSYKLQVTSLFEIDPSQAKSIVKLISATFPAAKTQIKQDLSGRNRVVIFEI